MKTKLIPWLEHYIYTEQIGYYDAKRMAELAGLVLLTRWELVRLYDTQEEFRNASRLYWTGLSSCLDSSPILASVCQGEDLEFILGKTREPHWAMFKQVSDET